MENLPNIILLTREQGSIIRQSLSLIPRLPGEPGNETSLVGREGILSVVPAIFPLKMFHTRIILLCFPLGWSAWNWRLGQENHTHVHEHWTLDDIQWNPSVTNIIGNQHSVRKESSENAAMLYSTAGLHSATPTGNISEALVVRCP